MFGTVLRPPCGRALIVVVSVLSVMWTPLFAQRSVPQSVLGNGGTDLQGTSYGVRGTIGQPGIGTASSGSSIAFVGYWYNPGTTTTAIDEGLETLPTVFSLDQNFPNPFNPSTTIGFALPERSHVLLTVYDARGALVATLIDGDMGPGVYKHQFDASRLATGVYFYRLRAKSFTQTRKLILLK